MGFEVAVPGDGGSLTRLVRRVENLDAQAVLTSCERGQEVIASDGAYNADGENCKREVLSDI